ncbi:MAG: hypothetical protein RIE58_07285 [Vicingaceae bacterium]
MKITKILAMMFLTGVVAFSSCKKDKEDPLIPPPPSNSIAVSSNITASTTWTTGKIYVLRGRIAVEDGVTLTIQPGVIVKGQSGTGANASALLVARGGKLMAEGTAAQPIIFTAEADAIQPGQIISPNLDPAINGLWGGVIICGKAKISASNSTGDVSEVQIEGIPTSDANGLYGGSDDMDNSGTLKYISIRHGGTNIGAGNEINGLTFGGVGSGTVVENIEVVANQDDGYEWFGGTVNVTNAISWNVGDDGFDTDQAWSGTLDNFYSITPSGHMFELDGPEGSMSGSHTIKNGTAICSDADVTSEDLINVDDNTEVSLSNIHFTDVQTGQKINRVTAALVSFSGITINVPQDSLASHVNGTVPAGVTAGGSSAANKAAFAGWSWADAAGVLK